MIERKPLRRLLGGSAPAPERVFFTEVWFRGHGNQRYAELLPRLGRVDPYLFMCSRVKYVRGAQFRALRATRGIRNRAVFAAARPRYRSMFAVNPEAVRYFDGPIVLDLDDPRFDALELDALARPNVRALVVTNERVASRYRELGVEQPIHVVPQGVSLGAIDPAAVGEVAARSRRPGEVVFGHVGSWLLSAGDRGGEDPRTNVDHLLDLWDELRERVPNGRLWLVGNPGKRVQRRCAGRDDVLLAGWHPRSSVLSWVSNFDVALFARQEDAGYQLIKIVEYMGCGVPTVSYDYEVTSDLRAAGAGLFASSARDWLEAAEQLGRDGELRSRVAAAARAAGASRDWDALGRGYEQLLDRYLPGATARDPAVPEPALLP